MTNNYTKNSKTNDFFGIKYVSIVVIKLYNFNFSLYKKFLLLWVLINIFVNILALLKIKITQDLIIILSNFADTISLFG